MKNLKNKLLLLLSFLMVFSFTMPLAGCYVMEPEVKPTVAVESIKFVSDMYDEDTGYAIFEVELNKETALTYEITPADATTQPIFSVFSIVSEVNRSKFKLYNEFLTVLEEDFEEIIVKIHCESFEDYCIVRLKENVSNKY